MAGSDKKSRRIDAGGNSTESPQSVSKTSSSPTDRKSLKEQDKEWGFEPSRSGMATEAKMGMGIVVILVCAFGFLVYHKFDLKQRALLQAQLKAAGDDAGELLSHSETSPIATEENISEFFPATPQPGATGGPVTKQELANPADFAELTPGTGKTVVDETDADSPAPFFADMAVVPEPDEPVVVAQEFPVQQAVPSTADADPFVTAANSPPPAKAEIVCR